MLAQRVMRLPAMREIWVRSLGWEDPLEKEMDTPLQYSCLESLMGRCRAYHANAGLDEAKAGINPEHSLEETVLKLKLQDLGHLTQRADSLEKPLMLGKVEERRRRGPQRMRWLDGSLTQWT